MSREPGISSLYQQPFRSQRIGPLYNAFSYPTKIDPETVAVFIATHTKPGEVVLDPFGGSGSTGIGAALCDRPTERMHSLASEAGVQPTWGPRKAILYELSPLGALLADVMANPPEPSAFVAAATRLIDQGRKRFGWAYEAASPDGRSGHIRYTVWSEVMRTPCCAATLTLWDAAVRLDPAMLEKAFDCPACGANVDTSMCDRIVSEFVDPVTGEHVSQREWRPARIYGESAGGTWSRPPTDADFERLDRVKGIPAGSGIPTGLINWGDLYRSGYHTGLTRFHHLYTDRNLKTLAVLWREIDRHDEALANALRLLVLSYNASHSTLMTRVVFKKNQKDLVVTGAQSGVMYVSGLPVEKNIFEGLHRKVCTFSKAFALTHGSRSEVTVINGSSTKLRLETDSVHYVFTDPPFGDFIPYAEINQVNEAWLGKLTDRADEVIISPAQGKGVGEYAQLMQKVFSEVSRVIRPSRATTVVFHASKPSVWNALGEAFRRNGFVVEQTSILNKTQISFKQVVHEGGTRGDALFLLRLDAESASRPGLHVTLTLERLIEVLQQAAHADPDELDPRRMYSRYVALCIEQGHTIELTAPEFYLHLAQRSSRPAAATV